MFIRKGIIICVGLFICAVVLAGASFYASSMRAQFGNKPYSSSSSTSAASPRSSDGRSRLVSSTRMPPEPTSTTSRQPPSVSWLILTTNKSEGYNEISGKDDSLGVHFTAQERGEKVVIDLALDTEKIIHAEIDYGEQKTLLIRSVSSVNGQLVELDDKDIIVFQKLLESVAQKINTVNTSGQLADALMSFLNLMSSAPSGTTLDIGE